MISRRLLLSVAGAALAVLMIVGVTGTGAWFTSNNQTGDVTLTSGQLQVDIGGPLAGGVTVGPLNPDIWSDYYRLTVWNREWSTIEAKYRITPDFPAGDLLDHLNAEVYSSHPVGGDCAAWIEGDPPAFGWDTPIYSGPLGDLLIGPAAEGGAVAFNDGELGINITHVLCFRFQLDQTAGNDLQDQSITGRFDVEATQINNPGWDE